LLQEALATGREVGDRWGVASWLYQLGRLRLLQENEADATALLSDSLLLFREMGDDHRAAECLERLAIVAGSRHHDATAARLFGAAEATRDALGASLSPADRDEHEPRVASARAALGATAFAASWEEGRALTLEEALEEARRTFPEPADLPSEERSILSARELEVLRLVAEGLTDPQIAERLHVSTRTVNAHLRTVYRKLRVRSRAAAVKRANELGLI
jgi:ATP/maltotriose-dependent transcriptional regulator MalT